MATDHHLALGDAAKVLPTRSGSCRQQLKEKNAHGMTIVDGGRLFAVATEEPISYEEVILNECILYKFLSYAPARGGVACRFRLSQFWSCLSHCSTILL